MVGGESEEMTNAEKIRSMTDRELAMFLSKVEGSTPEGFEEVYDLIIGSREGPGIELYNGFVSWSKWLERKVL